MKKIFSYLLVCSILASCSTSNQVVSNKLFQKRKYQKGWYVNPTKSYKKLNSKENLTVYNELDEVANDTAILMNKKKQAVIVKKEITINRVSQIERLKNKKLFRVIKKLLLVKKESITLAIKDFKRVESITKADKPPLDRTKAINRLFLTLLALGVIFYFQLSPLGILIALGKVESFKTNLILWLVGVMILAIALFTAFLSVLFTPVVIVMLIIGGAFIVFAHIHAIYVILRGY